MNVNRVDLSLTVPILSKNKLEMPIMLAPVAMQKLAHDAGEVAAARAASAEGTVYCTFQRPSTTTQHIIFTNAIEFNTLNVARHGAGMSQQATMSIEEISSAGGAGPKMFQVLWVYMIPSSLGPVGEVPGTELFCCR